MKHLKLAMGLSYMGHGVHATQRAPDVSVDDKTALELLSTGYFRAADGECVTTPPAAPTGAITALDTMGTTKLRAFAKEKGLDLSWPNGTKAEEIRADIEAALAKRAAESDNDGDDGSGDDGDADGGENSSGPIDQFASGGEGTTQPPADGQSQE